MSKEKKILGYIGTLFQILGRAKIGVGEKQDLHQSSFPYFFSILWDTIFCTVSVLQENPILVVVENSSLQIAFVVLKLAFLLSTDYGRPMKPFFIEILNDFFQVQTWNSSSHFQVFHFQVWTWFSNLGFKLQIHFISISVLTYLSAKADCQF